MAAPCLRILSRSASKLKPTNVTSLQKSVTYSAKFKYENEYNNVPEYPTIRDPSKEGKRRLSRLEWNDSVRALATVEEKLLTIAEKLYPNHKRYLLEPENVGYNFLPFLQYCTKTHVVDQLPESYGQSDSAELWLERLREPILEAIRVEKLCRSNIHISGPIMIREERETKCLLDQIIFIIVSSLSSEYKHLVDVEISKFPRCDSFWQRGHYHLRPKEKKTLNKDFTQFWFQYKWRPAYQLRITKPLPLILERDNPLFVSNDFPICQFHPSVYGLKLESNVATVTPGCWPNDVCQFPFLTLSPLASLHRYKHHCDGRDPEDAVKAMALLGSFGWLMGVAANQGFTPLHELTYPFTTQTVLTNGQEWAFFVYQLNTMAFNEDIEPQLHQNVLWCSGPIKLYQTIEDGQLKGVDEKALLTLLSFFTRKPVKNVQLDTQPFCWSDERSPEERLQVRTRLRRRYDNRPDPARHEYEVPTWHHVYKRNKLAKPTPSISLF